MRKTLRRGSGHRKEQLIHPLSTIRTNSLTTSKGGPHDKKEARGQGRGKSQTRGGKRHVEGRGMSSSSLSERERRRRSKTQTQGSPQERKGVLRL